MNNKFSFEECEFSIWQGRYSRILGDGGLFRVRNQNMLIDWKRNEETGTCMAKDSPDVRNLVKAVVLAKRRMGGDVGGGFIVNEWGQVIVPSSDGDGMRMKVGTVSGSLVFDNPFVDDSTIDLSNDINLVTGHKWPFPYLGIPYNLSGGNKIYFRNSSENGTQLEYLNSNGIHLVKKLRSVRPYGGIRFIVNYKGIVLTKKPCSSILDRWDPVYIGRIDYDNWFEQED